MAERTDEEIALSVQNGDAGAFGILVERYVPKMIRYAKKFLFGYHDAEDLVQEVFIKAYANIQSFNTKRPFSPWLYRIAHNEFVNAIKKKGREPIYFFDPDTLLPHLSSLQTPVSELLDAELKNFLEECLDKLKPKYRELLVLYFYEEMDYRTISDVLEIPISTVGVRLKRAKEQLAKIYNNSHHERRTG